MSFAYSPEFTADRFQQEEQRARQQARRRSAERAALLVCVATTLTILIAAVAASPRAAELTGYTVSPWLLPTLAAVGFLATFAFAFVAWRQRQ